MPNATNSVLTLPAVQTTNAGVYSVVISNPAGSTNSTNAVLSSEPPVRHQPFPRSPDRNINAGVTLVIDSVATDTNMIRHPH